MAKTLKKTATKSKSASKVTATSKKTAPKKAKKAPAKTAVKPRKKKALSEEVRSELQAAAIKLLQDAKATNIVSLDLRQIDDAVADFFIICQGDATTHIRSIATRLEEEIKTQLNEKPWHIEGLENLEWVIVDYVNVVIHIFNRDARDFYKLEDLWSDAERKEYAS